MAFEDVARRMQERHQNENLGIDPIADPIAYEAETMRDFERSDGRRQMLGGIALLVIGIVITAATYSSASSSGGGTYIVAYGPMIWGVIQLFRGLSKL